MAPHTRGMAEEREREGKERERERRGAEKGRLEETEGDWVWGGEKEGERDWEDRMGQ